MIASTSLLLALRRGPGRTTTASDPVPFAIPTPPTRLAGDPAFARSAAPATGTREIPVATRLRIVMKGIAPSLRTADSGVACFDATSGAGFVWTPVSEAAERDGSLELDVTVHGSNAQNVTVASKREFARHGYLALARWDPRSSSAGSTEVVLDATAQNVSFALPPSAQRAGPLRILRLDDPQWLPMELASTGLYLTRGATTTMLLGSGVYELGCPIDPERRQRFEVPADGAVVLTPALSLVPADRP